MDEGNLPYQLNSKGSLSNKVFDIAAMYDLFGLKMSLVLNVDIKTVLLESVVCADFGEKAALSIWL